MEGELRLELFLAAPGEDEVVGGKGGAQVVGVDGAVGVDDFGGADANVGACRAVEAEVLDAGEVLAEIDDIDAGFRLGDGFGGEGALDADGLEVLAIDLDAGEVGLPELDRLPAFRVEAGEVPAGLDEAGVLGFAVVVLSFEDG